MMKKFLLLALSLMMALSLAACAQAPAEAPSEAPAEAPSETPLEAPADGSLAALLAKGTLVQGMDDAFPPMSFRDENDQIVGFDVDLATEVAARMGVTLEPKPIDWNQKDNELNSGSIDVIWNGYTITPERQAANDLTPGYMENRQVLVVMQDSPVQALADFAGMRLAIQAASSAADALDANPAFKESIANGEALEFDDNMRALLDLEAGGCDGVLMDEVVAAYNISVGGAKYRIVDEALSGEEYGIGVKKGSVSLRDEIWRHLTEMAADGTLAEISNKWFGRDVTIVG